MNQHLLERGEKMTADRPYIVLITGIMAAGKSTIAQALAERFPKSVHLRGDVFRRMIVNGRADMGADFTDEDWAQLRLRYQLAANAAETYVEAGFTVVYQDVIIGAVLQEVVDRLKAKQKLFVVVLCPLPHVVAAREAGRGKVGYGSWTPADLDAALRTDTPRLGLWLDNSALSIAETVDTILGRLDEAAV
ncbi:MAG: AAA family ATPase [Chloroflexota bacterium]